MLFYCGKYGDVLVEVKLYYYFGVFFLIWIVVDYYGRYWVFDDVFGFCKGMDEEIVVF